MDKQMDHIHVKENIIQSQKGMKYWYNMDEPQKHYASERIQTQKLTYYDSLYMKYPGYWDINEVGLVKGGNDVWLGV